MHKTLFVLTLITTVYCYIVADEKITVPVDSKGERHIVLVVASYNNAAYYQQNLASIFDQLYKNYHVIYIDDCSTDDTYSLVKSYIYQRHMEHKVLLLHNEKRQGALCNQYHAIHQCKDTDLIIILDGDDWLFDNQVLPFINNMYANPNVWLTYGQFMLYPAKESGWCAQMPEHIVKGNKFREHGFIPGHLRTFYAGLFKQIKKEDLMYEGDFFSMSGDIAAMFPMIEMARDGHFRFISRLLMIYNDANPINNYKVVKGLERKLDLEIRQRHRYAPIIAPFLSQEGGIETAVTVEERIV